MRPDVSTPAGRAELEHAVALVAAIDDQDQLRRAERARQYLSAELAAEALSQLQLRAHAQAKFGAAAQRMYFSREGLEQASRTEVAEHRASRFAGAGLTSVLDLCCGIGADALAFVRAGLSVTGVEQDEATAELFRANLPMAEVVVGFAQDVDCSAAESVFLDPARRDSRRRLFDPGAFSPPFDFALSLLDQTQFAAVKLAPGLSHDLVPAGVEAEWVSWAGGVKEAVLWSAGFATAARRASVLTPTATATLTDCDDAQPQIAEVGGYLYEPDGAVIRAGLVQQVAALLPGGRRIDEHLAYLSCDAPLDTPLARGFAVLEVFPYSVKRLRNALKLREVGTVEIKKRGVDIDPDALRREIKPSGRNTLTVLLARVGEQRLAILADRLPSADC